MQYVIPRARVELPREGLGHRLVEEREPVAHVALRDEDARAVVGGDDLQAPVAVLPADAQRLVGVSQARLEVAVALDGDVGAQARELAVGERLRLVLEQVRGAGLPAASHRHLPVVEVLGRRGHRHPCRVGPASGGEVRLGGTLAGGQRLGEAPLPPGHLGEQLEALGAELAVAIELPEEAEGVSPAAVADRLAHRGQARVGCGVHPAIFAEGHRARLSRMAQAPALPGGFELPLEPRLPRIGAVDAVALEARAGELAKRSIKKDSKLAALDLVVRMIDLTTLEGADTPGKVAGLCSKAMRPDPTDPGIPPVAAVCVYPNLVGVAKERLAGSPVKVASVATAFPSGQSPLDVKLADVRDAMELGADEIDMVIDRGAFLSGRYAKVYDEIVRVKEASREAHLKVILETGELGTYDNVRRASLLAMAAGADFIKTSTGKVAPAATLPVTLCMLEAIRDVYDETGRIVGMKPAGGIRHAKLAIQYLCVLNETLGTIWMTPDLFRFGASSLLNDVLMQIRKQRTGVYQSGDYFTID